MVQFRAWFAGCFLAVSMTAVTDGHALSNLENINIGPIRLQLAQEKVSTDRWRKLTGPEIQRFFSDLIDVAFPGNEGALSEYDVWQFTFQSSGSWEGRNPAAIDRGSHSEREGNTWGDWRVEGDTLCVNVKGGDTQYTTPYGGCFNVYVDLETGIVAANIPALKLDRFVMAENAFGAIASLDRKRNSRDTETATSKLDPRNEQPITRKPDVFRKLTGPEIQRLFEGLEVNRYPWGHTTTYTAIGSWSISFDASGEWEGSTASGWSAFGDWRVEGDKLCINFRTGGTWNGNGPADGCFETFVNGFKGLVAASILSDKTRPFIIMDSAFSATARLDPKQKLSTARAKTSGPNPGTDQPSAREREKEIVEKRERERQRLARLEIEKQKREAEKQRKAERKRDEEQKRLALERQRLEKVARAEQREADKRREAEKKRESENQRLILERQRLEQEAKLQQLKLEVENKRQAESKRQTELKLQQLRLEVELERLRQQRAPEQRPTQTTKIDTSAPVIQAAANIVTRNARVTIQGVATDDKRLVRVELNGRRIETRNGRFSADAPVDFGRNSVRIAAYDAEGKKTEHVVTVIRRRDIPDIPFGDYYALVIGIDNYASLPKLNTAVGDARTVARMLEDQYGFTVTTLIDPSRIDIIDALDDFRDTLSEEDNLLIYYAGHGWLDHQTGTGYWMPVNAKTDRRGRWVSNATLTNALQTMPAKHVMVVADSCYSGTLTRSIKIPERNKAYLERIAEKRARVVLSSGGLEPVVDSGGGKHSVFAAQFLTALRDNQGVLDGTQLFERVRQKVVLRADQTPEYSDIRRAGHEGGDFLFVRVD